MSATATMPPENEFVSVVPPETSHVNNKVPDVDVEKRPPWVALICMISVCFLEGMDVALIYGCLFALQRDLGLTLGRVAILTSTHMLLSNVAAPFWGIIADRGMLKRRTILVVGCIGEGMVVMVLAFVQSFIPMIFLRAMSGCFMASLRPVCNALVADMTSDSNRGKVFGTLTSGFLLGIFSTNLVAGNVANLWIGDLQGWRLVIGLASVVAYIVAAVVWKFMIEPPHDFDGSKSISSELADLLRFFRIPTFSVMIMQGIFGNISHSVFGNKLLFFKLSGLPDWQATILTCEGTAVASFGVLLGGLVGDALTQRLGLMGRPLTAQISILLGVPVMYLQFWGIPAGEGTFLQYCLAIGAFALLGTWAVVGSVLPILSHIVPSCQRSKVMAWEGALESSVAAAIGPASISILADRLFGYDFGDAKTGQSIVAATALGKAMAVTICLPLMMSFLFYSLIYWSYPRDVRRLEHPKRWEDDAATSEFER